MSSSHAQCPHIDHIPSPTRYQSNDCNRICESLCWDLGLFFKEKMSINMSDPRLVPAEWTDTFCPSPMKSLPYWYDLSVCTDLMGTKLWVYASGAMRCPSGLRLRNTLWSDGTGCKRGWTGVSLCFCRPSVLHHASLYSLSIELRLSILSLTLPHGQLQAGPQNHIVCRVSILS